MKKIIIVHLVLLILSSSMAQAATCAENFREAVGEKELQKESDLMLKSSLTMAGVITTVGVGAGIIGASNVSYSNAADKISGGIVTGTVAASVTGTSMILVVQELTSYAAFIARLTRLSDDSDIGEGYELKRFADKAEGLFRQSTNTFHSKLAQVSLAKVIVEQPELCKNNQVALVYSNIMNATLAEYKLQLSSSQK